MADRNAECHRGHKGGRVKKMARGGRVSCISEAILAKSLPLLTSDERTISGKPDSGARVGVLLTQHMDIREGARQGNYTHPGNKHLDGGVPHLR